MLTTKEIMDIIPHRHPFLLVDTIEELQPGKRAVGYKCITYDEPYFAGHFPDAPIMPGVLVIEACAQLCSITMESQGTEDDKIYVLLKCEEFKFLRPVIPGDCLEIEVRKESGGAGLVKFNAKVMVDGKVKAKGILAFTSMNKEDIYNQ